MKAPRLDLSRREVAEIDTLRCDLIARYGTLDDPDLPVDLAAARRHLPDRLCRALEEFRLGAPPGALVVSGLSVEDDVVGPTPLHWNRADPTRTLPETLVLLLLGSTLGDAFSWLTLQGGALVQDVLPIPGHEKEQTGHSSRVFLEWHVEDAFHPYRPDYLGLLAVRNTQRVATGWASLAAVDLACLDVDVLFEPRFVILPDNAHVDTDPEAAATQGLTHELPPVAAFFGARDEPYIRIDPAFMRPLPGDVRAAEALANLLRHLIAVAEEVRLDSGDMLFLDNFVTVHGRQPFRAQYDGTDRWLKKVLLTRDLRRSRACRSSRPSRVISGAPGEWGGRYTSN